MIRFVGATALVVLALAGPAQARQHATVLKISTASGAMMKYSTSTLKAKAGVVTIVMTNAGILPHNVAVKGNGVNVKGKIVAKGQTSKVTATLKKGRYTFYCTVPGHERAGMKGTLTVS